MFVFVCLVIVFFLLAYSINLANCHLIHREVYPEVPPRVEYSLTDIGKSLIPAIASLIVWGKEHLQEVVTE